MGTGEWEPDNKVGAGEHYVVGQDRIGGQIKKHRVARHFCDFPNDPQNKSP